MGKGFFKGKSWKPFLLELSKFSTIKYKTYKIQITYKKYNLLLQMSQQLVSKMQACQLVQGEYMDIPMYFFFTFLSVQFNF